MIKYDEGRWSIGFAFQWYGTVIDRASVMAGPCAIVSVSLHTWMSHFPESTGELAEHMDANLFSGFSFILGFLIVFRTQTAYSRWWEGGTLLQQLRGDWFNACSNLMAFLNTTDKRKERDVKELQHKLVRLFSLLYGFALRQVSESTENNYLEFINLAGFDARSLSFLAEDQCHDQCEVVLQWLQRLIVEANSSDLIKIAPPILARVYNQLGQGIVKLNNARKIKEFPVPFSLAQMIAIMLLLHLISTALFCALSVSNPVVCFVAAFIVSFSFWGVNFIAVELENPYGSDANDLPLSEMQADLNASLVSLLNPLAMKPPLFTYDPERDGDFREGAEKPGVQEARRNSNGNGNGKSIKEVLNMDEYVKQLTAALQAAPADAAAPAEDDSTGGGPPTPGPARSAKAPEAAKASKVDVEVDNCMQGTCSAGSAMTGGGQDSGYRDSVLQLHHESRLGKAQRRE